MILHALICEKNSVIVAKDTDVLILLAWAYDHFNVKYKWFFSHEKDVYADISVICAFLGEEICSSLLSFHTISGCDTTSFMSNVGKLRCFRKLMNHPEKCELLKALENGSPLTEDEIGNLKLFVQTVMYSGRSSETYLETRIRLYKQQKQKTSTSLPPDPNSLFHALWRAQLQVYIWRRCNEININIVDPLNYGWRFDESEGILLPVWFTVKQFPPSLC